MSVTRRSSRQAACLVFGVISLATLTAQAQTLEGKAPANGKVMSFNELKACIVQQETLKTRRTSLETERAKLDGERTQIQQEAESIKKDRESLDAMNGQIRELNERMKAHTARIEDYNARMAEFEKEGNTGRSADRKRKEFDKELAEIKAADASLRSDGDRIKATLNADVVAKINARVEAQSKAAADWNARSRAVDEGSQKYEEDRSDWRTACGDRRYREDDEKLIRADLAKGK